MTLIEKRRKILHQIDKYNTQRCKKCGDADARDNHATQCQCQAAKNIRKLGDRLMKLTNPRKDESTELMNMLFVPENLTNEIYARLKYLKVRDDTIAAKIGIKKNSFTGWKSKNGIKSKYDRGSGYER